jgi:isopropylmalate/homocitrate/citramalate synthase
MAWQGKDWRKKYKIRTVEDQIEWASTLISYAKKVGVKASAGVNMLAYSNAEYLEKYCSAIARAGADYLCFYDGSSGMGPEAWEYVISLVKRAAPQPRVSVHPHMAFGLGVANALSAVRGGADVVEVSVNRLCSASGQADLAEVAAALEILYGVDTGIRLEKLTPLRRLVEDITGVKMSQNKPVTGERAWAYSEGLIVNELAVEPLLHWCVEPSIFGNKKLILLGKNADPWSVESKLQTLGVKVPKELLSQVVERIRSEISIRKRALTDEEIREIAESVEVSAGK